MASIKKEVVESITKKLLGIQTDLRRELRNNKIKLKEIALRQTLAKRELAAINIMISSIRVKP
jgi:hypothetical protein